jgi:hypothetical protein
MNRRHAKRLGVVLPLAIAAAGLVGFVVQAQTPDERALFTQQLQDDREKAEAEIAAWQEAGRRVPSEPDDPEGARPEPEATEWAEGIFGREEVTFPSSYGFEFLNVWYHDDGEVYVTVLAGSEVETERAVVQVIHVDPVTLRSELLPPLYPDVAGPVRIVRADGESLIVESVETKDQLTFDSVSLLFTPV